MGYYFCEKQNQQLGITVYQTARKVFKYSLTNSVLNIQTDNRQFMDLHLSVWIAFFKLLLFFFTLQYCIGFAIHQHESTRIERDTCTSCIF